MREVGINFTEAIKKSWQIAKFKYYLKVRNGKEIVNLIEDNRDNAVNVYGSGGVFKKTDRYLYSGCSVLFGRKGTIGKPLYVNERFWTVDTMYYTTFFNNMLPKFAYYIFSVFPWEAYTTKTALPSIVGTDIENAKWPIPKRDEQNKLVNFLDKKTTEIDALIADKEKLIELLEEKRQAVITETVTKGLDPNVKMKDSGVEWIGEIPEHWDLRRMKTVAELLSSNVDKKIKEDEQGVLLCNYVDVYYNDSINNEYKSFLVATATVDEIKKFKLFEQDVIVTKDSESFDDIVIPTLVEEDLKNVLCGYHLSIFRPKKEVIKGEFLYNFLSSHLCRSQYYPNANGVTRFGISKPALSNGFIFLPPLDEQEEINEYLNNLIFYTKEAVADIKKQINKLKEYRQSLIYEAVTGKIDVREMVGETNQEEVSSS